MAHDRWAYQVVELSSTFLGPPKAEVIQEKLNQMGLGGWELVSIVQALRVTLFFKRPL
ncbi:MAG: DUF4177 domain-containing protein [Arenimonas sp.]